jgi:hypothetical protein
VGDTPVLPIPEGPPEGIPDYFFQEHRYHRFNAIMYACDCHWCKEGSIYWPIG